MSDASYISQGEGEPNRKKTKGVRHDTDVSRKYTRFEITAENADVRGTAEIHYYAGC